MRGYSQLIAACLLLTGGSAAAGAQIGRLVLDPSLAEEGPSFTILADDPSILKLEFSLPAMDLEEIAIDGDIFQALTIQGGNIAGEEGQPGLPVITRLVAVPAQGTVSAKVVRAQRQVLPGFRLFPVQPDEGEALVIDRSSYERSGGLEAPALEVGEPAMLRDLRVVPLTFRPVSFDPASGALSVAARMEVELEFTGGQRALSARHQVPESFDRLYRDTVLGYRGEDAEVVPGTYLFFCRDDADLLTRVSPVLQWRARQGYNVALETLTGSETNAQIKAVIQSYYDSVEPPLEYVVLAGDATGSCSIPAGEGQGDHAYTLLEGGDVLSDVHTGRLSFESTSQIDEIVDKIITYETEPPTTDAGWFTRACVTGSTSGSGITCIYINQWLKRELLAQGYTQVDTIWGGNFPVLMSASINQGLTVFGYRGYLGMSGFTSGHIDYLANGDELPFALFPTCDTGTWVSGTARSESFIRTVNGGAIGAIGTATTGTHTRYNNCFYQGVWEGLIDGAEHHQGAAFTRGKLELYNNYINYEPGQVSTFSEWNNLIGDPATDVWTSYPAAMTVTHPASLPVGANSVPVKVRVGMGSVTGARVCAYKEGEVSSTGYTDENGEVNLPISGYTPGTLLVTVTAHNHFAYLGSLSLGPMSVFAGYYASTVDDDNAGDSAGDDDGVVNPGEAIELPVALHNYGSGLAAGVTATLTSGDPYVTIIDGDEIFGNIAADATVWSAEDFDFSVAPDTPDGHALALDLVAHSYFNEWTSVIELTVRSAAFALESTTWGGGGGTLDPGESGSFTIAVRNTGSLPAASAEGQLSCESPWVAVTDGSEAFGTVAVDGTSSGSFALAIDPACFQGHEARFSLTMSFNGGRQDVVEFSLPVGVAGTDDPLGCDEYGYYAFDNTDITYPFAPAYEWVEIAPNHGGSGTSVGLTDFGFEQDDNQLVTLPFTFTYYGRSYSQATICSNGWIAMGATPCLDWRNWAIPCGGNPDPLIAVFWDDLEQRPDDLVYHWYDEANGRYIVQWSRLREEGSGTIENVEVILYDPSVYPTSTGDGIIVMQYETVVNNDSDRGYATVGIQNPSGDDGLCYTYANDYWPGAAPLVNGRAIRFIPVGDMSLGTLAGHVSNVSNGGTPVGGALIRIVQNNQAIFSQASGDYSGGVMVGTYTIRAEHESFETVTVYGVEIDEGQTTVLDFALVDILGPTFTNTTQLGYTDDTAGPYVVDTWVSDYSAIAELHFYYRQAAGPQIELPLALIDAELGRYRAEIPGQPVNSWVRYWLEGEDSAGNTSRDPETPGECYEFWVLERAVDIHHDMEAEQGWTASDTGDNATTGIWVRADPIGVWQGGVEVQPENDASDPGVSCWITGNNENGTQGTDDVDGGVTTLLSPWFDLSGIFHAEMSYRRWFTNDTGNNPGQDAWVVEATADGVSWIQLENALASDRSWSQHSYILEDLVALSSTVRFRFIARDDSPGSLIEAGVDEFMLAGYYEPDPTAAPASATPKRLALWPNVPNPFNPETSIRFDLPAAQTVNLRIYDTSGRLVRTLLSGARMAAGHHHMSWDGRDESARALSSGLYFYVLETEAQRLSRKMTLLK